MTSPWCLCRQNYLCQAGNCLIARLRIVWDYSPFGIILSISLVFIQWKKKKKKKKKKQHATFFLLPVLLTLCHRATVFLIILGSESYSNACSKSVLGKTRKGNLIEIHLVNFFDSVPPSSFKKKNNFSFWYVSP